MSSVLLFRPINGNVLYSWNGKSVIALDSETGIITPGELLREGSNLIEEMDHEVLDKANLNKRIKKFQLKSTDRKEFTVVARIEWPLF